MCSPHNFSSNLSLVHESYAAATVPEETYFLVLILQSINEKLIKINNKDENIKTNI